MTVNGLTHFYRYSPATRMERLEQVMLRHEIYIPTVTQLNDPADARPRFGPATARQIAQLLARKRARRYPGTSLVELADNARIIAQGLIEGGTEWALREMTTLLQQELTELKIFSMSKRWDNMAMWAKYADDHRGYCLEFRNVGPLFTAAREVQYGPTIPLDVSSADLDDIGFAFQKRPDWSSEEEIRLVRPTFWPSKTPIDPTWLSRIFLGRHMIPENRATIRAWTAQRDPAMMVSQLEWDPHAEALRITD
jgi:hypothetical protein